MGVPDSGQEIGPALQIHPHGVMFGRSLLETLVDINGGLALLIAIAQGGRAPVPHHGGNGPPFPGVGDERIIIVVPLLLIKSVPQMAGYFPVVLKT